MQIENYKIKGSSNHFVNNICLITELRSQVSETLVNLLSPYNNFLVKEFWFKERRLQSISFLLCRRYHFSCAKFWQWESKYLVVSVSLPQLQIGFNESRKLWWNLCSLSNLDPNASFHYKRKVKNSKIYVGTKLVHVDDI